MSVMGEKMVKRSLISVTSSLMGDYQSSTMCLCHGVKELVKE